MTGGAGHDVLRGGAGGDTYLLRAGDQSDEAEDVVTAQVVGAITAPDPVKARFAGIAAGTIARNWGGDAADLRKAREINDLAAAAAAAAGNGGGSGTGSGGTLPAPESIAPVEGAGEDSIVFGAARRRRPSRAPARRRAATRASRRAALAGLLDPIVRVRGKL